MRTRHGEIKEEGGVKGFGSVDEGAGLVDKT